MNRHLHKLLLTEALLLTPGLRAQLPTTPTTSQSEQAHPAKSQKTPWDPRGEWSEVAKSTNPKASSGVPYPPGSWMYFLPDDRKLSAMSIPGTHNTMAANVNQWARCQNDSLYTQLEDCGVRFIDIRLRQMGDGFSCHHGMVYLGKNFTDVLNDLKRFLQAHTRETIIMSVKPEYDSEPKRLELKDPNKKPTAQEIRRAIAEELITPGSVRRLDEQYYWFEPFSELLMSYVNDPKFKDLFLRSSSAKDAPPFKSIPSLGSARGKIILVRRFKDKNTDEGNERQKGNPHNMECGGIDASNWTPDGNPDAIGQVGSNPDVFAQDLCESPNDDRERPFNTKKQMIKDLMTFSKYNPESLCLNFNSAYIKYGGLPYPEWAADEMRPWLINHLNTKPEAPFGVIIVDFVDKKLAEQIYSRNFNQGLSPSSDLASEKIKSSNASGNSGNGGRGGLFGNQNHPAKGKKTPWIDVQ